IGENLIRWEKQYGSFFRVHGFLNRTFMITTDLKMVQKIFSINTYEYRKTRQFPQLLDLVGEGLIFAEGNVHQRQRKMMNPAFSFTNTKVFISLLSTRVNVK
ncbi:7469_t:CDS:1, partial [Racocetra persica]